MSAPGTLPTAQRRRRKDPIPQTGVQCRFDLAGAGDARGAAYLYDGTPEGLLSAVFAATAAHDPAPDIVRDREVQPRLAQELVPVATDLGHARRIQRTLVCAHGPEAFEAVYLASLLDGPQAPQTVERFIRMALQLQNPCRTCAKRASCNRPCQMPQSGLLINDLGNPLVWELRRLVRAVINERHRMLQFLRFEHGQTGPWFARCNPKAAVVPLVMRHFTARMGSEPFLIFDEVHGMAGIWDGRQIHYAKTDEVTPPPVSVEESTMQEAWRMFWRSIAIPERYNPELQCQLMPKRLWRNLTEMQAGPDTCRARTAAALEPSAVSVTSATAAVPARPSRRMAV